MKNSEISEILITEEQIESRINEIAKLINTEYKNNDNLIVIGILNGSTIFHSDLIRKLKLHLKVDWISLSSYGSGTKSSGVVRVIKDLTSDIKGKDIIIVEDILDTGLTLSWLANNLKTRGVNSCEIVTLLKKKQNNSAVDNRINCKWVGFEIPDKFVVGYGLDYDGKYRNLPYVGILDYSIYGG